MSNIPGLLILMAVLLGSALMRRVKTFRQHAMVLSLIGLGTGVGLGTYYASQLADPSFENQAKMVAGSMAISAAMSVLAILIMWLMRQRRMN